MTSDPISALPGAFDYAAVAPELADRLRDTAKFIRIRRERMHEDAVDIGSGLVEAKAALPHGQFLPWIEAEFGWTARTAQNLMRVAEVFAGKSETISYLPAGVVYNLAAAPEPIRAAVLATIEAERPAPDAVKQLLRDGRAEAAEQRKQALKQARQSPEQRKADDRKKARQQEERTRAIAERAVQERERREALDRLIRALRERWDDVEDLIAMLKEAGEGRLADLVRNAPSVMVTVKIV